MKPKPIKRKEIYLIYSPLDKACHAYNNKKTEKTKYFWLDGGHLYIYSIYGSNICLNVVAGLEN